MSLTVDEKEAWLKREAEAKLEQTECERLYLPESIKDFSYASCLRFAHNDAGQPNVQVGCKCHFNLTKKRFIFAQLGDFFQKRVEEEKIDTGEMEELFRLCHEINPFDCDTIRRLSLHWSCILYFCFKTRCITAQIKFCSGNSLADEIKDLRAYAQKIQDRQAS